MWASSRNHQILLHANNNGTEQPEYPHSLIRAFVVPFLGKAIAKLTTCKISMFYSSKVMTNVRVCCTATHKPKTNTVGALFLVIQVW